MSIAVNETCCLLTITTTRAVHIPTHKRRNSDTTDDSCQCLERVRWQNTGNDDDPELSFDDCKQLAAVSIEALRKNVKAEDIAVLLDCYREGVTVSGTATRQIVDAILGPTSTNLDSPSQTDKSDG